MINYSSKIYAKALLYLFKEKKLNLETLRNFLKILIKNNQLKILSRIFQEFEKLYKRDFKILEVNISTPQKISKKEFSFLKKEIKKKYRPAKISFNEIIKENLIGGLKVEIEDEIIDASLKNFLFKLEKSLVK
jgi:F-type H+-transporting ATPase subunit delta